jgi:hypothetical protein
MEEISAKDANVKAEPAARVSNRPVSMLSQFFGMIQALNFEDA